MTQKELYRHGEIIFKTIESLPTGLKKTETNLIMTGSGSNPHTFKGGKIYLKTVDEYVFGYFQAKNTKLYHCEHSPDGVLLPNGYYEIRRAVEYTPDGLKPVID